MKQLFHSKKRTGRESVEQGMGICCSISTAFWVQSITSVATSSVVISLIGMLGIGVLVYALLQGGAFLIRKLFREWTVWMLYLLVVTAEVMAVLDQSHVKQGLFFPSMALSIAISAVTIVFAGTLFYQIYQRKRSIVLWIILTISGIGVLVSVLFLTGDGIDSHWQETHLLKETAWKKEVRTTPHLKENEVQSFQKTVEEGTMNTAMLTYGTEKSANLKSVTADLSPYVNGYTGWTKKMREWEDGFSLKEIPLRGNIYFPQNEKNCPVLFLIHGQHERWTASYEGYEYLGKYLASHGYVLVTVDENALNSGLVEEVSQENDARAILLLENIKQVLSFNRDPSTPLYQKMNADKIALAGHSRGGEAIVDAALFSQQSHYPGNGNRLLPYRFSIEGLLAIAPTSGQYNPADHEVALKDISYLVLQGAEDQDVTTFPGLDTYENITFRGRKSEFKSALLIGGANHGQFNSLWGSTDTLQPFASGLNTAQLMPKKEQQRLLKIFTKIFLDVTLRGDTRFANLFWDYAAYQEELPKTVYSQQYQNSTYQNLADFEEDSNLITGAKEGTFAGATALAEHTTLWGEETYSFSEDSIYQICGNHVLHLKWKNAQKAPTYTCKFNEYDATGEYLQFDISQRQKDTNIGEKALQTAQVVFTDMDDHETILPLSAYMWIHSPFAIESSKIQSLCHIQTYKYPMQTIRIPIADVRTKSGEAVQSKNNTDVRHLVKVSLRFQTQTEGDIMVDKIGFSK
ncbi:MAG: hypothetical protein ACI4HI_01930 [Lachnospiraceae bacterium]